jgi:2-phosphosulfolactate phosphatase
VVIQSTRAGTVGAAAASQATRLFGASFVVAEATARALRHEVDVTLVPMGLNGTERTLEDELCALYLRERIAGRRVDAEAFRRVVAGGPEAARFGDPRLPHFPEQDLAAALDVDAFDFAIAIERRGELLVAVRHPRREGPDR